LQECGLRLLREFCGFLVVSSLRIVRQACGIAAAAAQSAGTGGEALTYFRQQAQSTQAETDNVAKGAAVAKLLDTGGAPEIIVAGVVRVRAHPDVFVQRYEDLSIFKNSSGYLMFQKFSSPPQESDVARMKLEKDDIKDLRTCKIGDCVIQMPGETIERARSTIDRKSPDAATEVNNRLRKGIIEGLMRWPAGRRYWSPAAKDSAVSQLKLEAAVKLDDARVAVGGGDAPEVGVGRVDVGSTEVGVVGGVQQVDGEAEAHPLSDGELA
jgi:hypothetical protein